MVENKSFSVEYSQAHTNDILKKKELEQVAQHWGKFGKTTTTLEEGRLQIKIETNGKK